MSEPRRAFYVIVPTVAAIVGVLLVELILALFYPIPFTLERNMYFENDPHTGFRNKPLAHGYYPSGIEANANRHGHRDDPVTIEKSDGVYRILVLGDSFTVGANVEQHEAYPQVLETLLNEATGTPVEVVNTGTGGWSPYQYAQYLEHYGLAFAPDLVLVGFFVGNDAYGDASGMSGRSAVLGRRVSRSTEVGPHLYLKVLLYEHSNIARALIGGGPADVNFVRAQCDQFTDYYINMQLRRRANHLAEPDTAQLLRLDENVAHIERVRQLAAGIGAPTVVYVFPDELQTNPALRNQVIEEAVSYDFDQPQALLAERFDVSGVAYVDLLQTVRDDERCLYMNDTHWTAAGHRLVAGEMLDSLTQLGLLP